LTTSGEESDFRPQKEVDERSPCCRAEFGLRGGKRLCEKKVIRRKYRGKKGGSNWKAKRLIAFNPNVNRELAKNLWGGRKGAARGLRVVLEGRPATVGHHILGCAAKKKLKKQKSKKKKRKLKFLSS